jgi:hypothetical protein
MVINQIMSNEDEGVRVSGQMLSKTVGLYAGRIVAQSKMDKPLSLIGPPQMQMVKPTLEFIMNFPGPLEDIFHSQDPKVLEIYVSTRGAVDKIPYGKPNQERIDIRHLTLAYRIKCDIMPDPRTEIEDAKDREDYEQAKSAELARKEEERKQKEVDEQLRREEKKRRMENLENAAAGRNDG